MWEICHLHVCEFFFGVCTSWVTLTCFIKKEGGFVMIVIKFLELCQIQRHITLWRTGSKQPYSPSMPRWASCWGASQQLWGALGWWPRCVWVPCWGQPHNTQLACPWDRMWYTPCWRAFHSVSQPWKLSLPGARWTLFDGCIQIWTSLPRSSTQAPYHCTRRRYGFY